MAANRAHPYNNNHGSYYPPYNGEIPVDTPFGHEDLDSRSPSRDHHESQLQAVPKIGSVKMNLEYNGANLLGAKMLPNLPAPTFAKESNQPPPRLGLPQHSRTSAPSTLGNQMPPLAPNIAYSGQYSQPNLAGASPQQMQQQIDMLLQMQQNML